MWIMIAIVGIAAFGVGAFPETTGIPHYTFALIAFGGGALTAINSARMVRGNLRYLVVVLGLISLLALFTGVVLQTTLGFGHGGLERVVAYPVFLWALIFGGYLLNTPGGTVRRKRR